MLLCRAVLIVYLVSTGVWTAEGQRFITWTNISYRYNTMYIGNVSYSIIQPQNKSFNLEGDYFQDICENFAYLDIKVPQAQKTGFVHLFNYKVKVSDFITKTLHNNNFFKMFYISVEKYSNLPKKCPLPANSHLYFRNFTIPAEQMPIFLPEMNFLSVFKMTRPNDNFVAELVLKGKLVCKERKGFGCGTGIKRG